MATRREVVRAPFAKASGARALAACSFVLLWCGGAEAAGIVDLVPLVRKHAIRVSFAMRDAFSPDVEQAVASGLQVNFDYEVQLKKVRTLWLNQKLVSRRIRTTVVYDNLTKRHKLTREIDGQIVATEVVSDPEVMRRFMTRFENLELFDVALLEPNSEYYLRVKGVVKERNFFLFIPWDFGSGWTKSYFTYIP